MEGPVEIKIGSGLLGLRMNGQHLVLVRGKKKRPKFFKIPDKYIGVEVTLVAIVSESDTKEKSDE